MKINRENKVIILILVINLLILLASIFISGFYNNNFSINHFEEKSAFLLSDTYRNIKAIEFVSKNGKFPNIGQLEYVPPHPPVYYFLSAPVVLFANLTNQNVMLMLEIFSITIMFLSTLIFLMTLKRIKRHFKNKNFIIYAIILFCFLPATLASSRLMTPDVLFFLLLNLSLYFYVKLIETKSKYYALFLGIIMGLAFWTWFSVIPLLVSLFIYIIILHFFKRYKERNLLLSSFIIAVLMGIYPLINAFRLFGSNLIGNITYAPAVMHQGTNIFLILKNILFGYWGGVYGGIRDLRIIRGIFILLLGLYFLNGILKSFKNYNYKTFYNFITIFLIIFILFSLHHNCDIPKFLLTKGCFGWGTQARYLIPLNPLIAIFSSIGLINLENKNKKFKVLNYLFMFIISFLFIIDFLVAFA